MLKLDNISKTYKIGAFGGKELQAVRNVSFNVGECEVVSLIGESGSGKSTIGRMILRLISITSGRIVYKGTDIASVKGPGLKEYYRSVQGVFQDPFSSLNPIFKADRIFDTVHDEFFPDVPAGEWAERLNTALESVGLNPEHVLHKYPHQLSGGQVQRFLIARALLLDIRFLVADEIISMLDASTRIDVLNLLADLKARGLSILFITHDLSLAHYISERAVILYRGAVAELGAAGAVFQHPLHPYTQMLMASVPRLDRKWDVNTEDINQVRPAPANGCAYYDRCPIGTKECTLARPPLVEVEPGHFVACIRPSA